MRTILPAVLMWLVAAQLAHADKAALSADQLEQEAGLIVVGTIGNLRIESEPSQAEPARGNLDWAIYVTIQVDVVERGAWLHDQIEARCYRIQSRASHQGFFAPSGHRPIPELGTRVRAYLSGSAGSWAVVLPNGLSSAGAGTEVSDDAQVAALRAGYAYLLPMEAWWLLALVGVAIVLLGATLRRRVVQNGSYEVTRCVV